MADEEESDEERTEATHDEAYVPAANEPVTADDAPDFEPFKAQWGDFTAGAGVYVTGKDGIVGESDQTTESDIPALSTTSLICMGDFSSFVLRDEWGQSVMTFEPKEVERAPDGRWRVRIATALAKFMESLHPLLRDGKQWVEVFPIRPPCKHYIRQKLPYTFNAKNKEQARLCAARRHLSGAFMNIGNSGIWACDMREPRDLASERELDEFDERKIKEGAQRVYLPIKGADAAPTGGIFSGAAEPKT